MPRFGGMGTGYGRMGAVAAPPVTAAVAVSAPTNSVAPVISGNVQVGQTLSTTDGTWTGSPTFTYQWKRNGVDIASATNNTYLLAVADAGTAGPITCSVTGTNGAGNATAASNSLTIDVYIVLTAHVIDPADATTYSAGVWNGVAIGTAAANRKILLALAMRNSGNTPTFSSGTVGAASLAAAANASNDTNHNRVDHVICDITTGTTANISVTLSAASQRLGAGVYAIYGASSSTPTATASQTTDNTSTNLAVSAKGVAVGNVIGTGTTLTNNWTGVTEDYDEEIEASVIQSGACLNSNAGGTIAMKYDVQGALTTNPAGVYSAFL